MFSNLSESSISLATVTPSLVIRGAPKDLSMTTLRPFGPSVTFTASARMLTPRTMRSRASPPNFKSLGAILLYPRVVLFGVRSRDGRALQSGHDLHVFRLLTHPVFAASDLYPGALPPAHQELGPP